MPNIHNKLHKANRLSLFVCDFVGVPIKMHSEPPPACPFLGQFIIVLAVELMMQSSYLFLKSMTALISREIVPFLLCVELIVFKELCMKPYVPGNSEVLQ